MDGDAADRDGLADGYDVIVLGTGLVESIVACALARSGRTVLHLDSSDRYGSCCAAVGFDAFARGEIGCAGSAADAAQASAPRGVVDDTEGLFRRDASCMMRVVARSTAQAEVGTKAALVSRHKQRNPAFYHPSCVGYVMERAGGEGGEGAGGEGAAAVSPVFIGYLTHKELTAQRASAASNDFNIDLTSTLLLAGGASINHLINSGVSHYLEFKAVDSLHFCLSGAAPTPVPCSKSDVFNTKSLSGPEKRSLMKFLQFAMDWGREHAGEDPLRLNEAELARGRSLHRPQNKTHSALAYDVRAFVGRPFDAFLEHCGLSERMRQMITYALCLQTAPCGAAGEGQSGHMDAEGGLQRLCTHLNSLGRFGPTAFLSPLYGCSELPQAFCRMCAVWGGVYVLRNGVSRLLLKEGGTAVEGVVDDAGRAIRCATFVCRASDLNLDCARITAAAICRTGVFTAAVLPDALAVAVIPPLSHGVGNPEAIVAVQADSTVNVAPPGAVVVHLTMRVAVPALRAGREWEEYSRSQEAVEHAETLVRALTLLKRAGCTAGEVAHLTTIRPIAARRGGGHCPWVGAALPHGMAVCGDTSCDADLDAAFAQAEETLRELAPGVPFFPKGEAEEQGEEGCDDVPAEELERALRRFSTVEPAQMLS